MYERGRNTKFELTDVTTVFEERDDHAEPLTASEGAEVLGCSQRTALNKPHELVTRTELTNEKIGGRSRVCWIPIHT
jgi:hypothetical protein